MAKAKSVVGLSAHSSTGTNARLIARTRLEELYAWDRYTDIPYAVHELHDLRIAAKRLRYTLEIFSDVLPAACQPVVKEVEQIQEELGSLHDSDVLISLLRLCLGSWDAGPAYASLLAHTDRIATYGRVSLNPDLLAALLDPCATPSADERSGLELLVSDLQSQRNALYTSFHQHWTQLKQANFFQKVLAILAD